MLAYQNETMFHGVINSSQSIVLPEANSGPEIKQCENVVLLNIPGKLHHNDNTF
jgi:hypothetical protein